MWRIKKISKNMTVVMWVSGLRGAIAFALSLRLPCQAGFDVTRGTEECKNSDMLVTTTISIVMLTTLGVGTAMERFMTMMGVLEIAPAGSSPRSPEGRALTDALTRNDGGQLAVPFAGRGVEADADEDARERLPFASGNARSLLHARGWVYQAFARFDLNYLQPALGGPCRGRVADATAEPMELPSLQAFVAPPAEPPPPDWSRASIFE